MKSLSELRNENVGGEKPPKKSDDKQKNKEQKSLQEQVISLVKTVVSAFVIVIILNGLLVATFVVPTPSMEKTVMTGDFLFVNKFIYGPSTPQIIPLFNIPLPFYRFPGIREPEKGDVIVFIYPGDRDQLQATDFQYYLKRCVATGGDTLVVKDKRVFVNGVEFPLPEHGQVIPNIDRGPSESYRTFPPGAGFTLDNYGPIVIPKKGMVIPLTKDNLRQWEILIRREGHLVSVQGNDILIDGKIVTSYAIERDYCFGMGDNRDMSADSREWGFIPVENVVGTPMIVYWSWDTNEPNIFKRFASIRFGRLGTIIR